MPMGETITLIDGDCRRRAQISHVLSGRGHHVEPYESVSEFESRIPDSGLVLICDQGDAVQTVLSAMSRRSCWLPVVAFSEQPRPSHIVDAVMSGVVGYLAWPWSLSDLDEAVARGVTVENSRKCIRVREALAKSRLMRLTPREKEVLEGITNGLANRQIGEHLAISPRTVEIHRANMLDKLGASHSSEAIRIAVEASLLSSHS